MFDGFKSRWMTPFWCGVLHGRADLAEERESFDESESVLVAIIRERDTLDQLHHEERPSGLGRPGVEHLGDVRVFHQGQRLPLRLEAAEDGFRVHSRLDEFERDLSLDRLRLLGEIDAAHAPLADFLADFVAADDRACSLPNTLRRGRSGCLLRTERSSLAGSRDVDRGAILGRLPLTGDRSEGLLRGRFRAGRLARVGPSFEEAAGCVQGPEQGVDLASKLSIASAARSRYAARSRVDAISAASSKMTFALPARRSLDTAVTSVFSQWIIWVRIPNVEPRKLSGSRPAATARAEASR